MTLNERLIEGLIMILQIFDKEKLRKTNWYERKTNIDNDWILSTDDAITSHNFKQLQCAVTFKSLILVMS